MINWIEIPEIDSQMWSAVFWQMSKKAIQGSKVYLSTNGASVTVHLPVKRIEFRHGPHTVHKNEF